MSESSSDVPAFAAPAWRWLFISSALLPALATPCLWWLLWTYIPEHANMFALLGLPLPYSTRLAIVTSNEFIRLLPFVALGLTLLGPFIVRSALRALRAGRVATLRLAAAAVLFVGLSEAAACSVVVYAVHQAYSHALADSALRDALQAFAAYRTANK